MAPAVASPSADEQQHSRQPAGLLTRLYDGWMALQVELQGQYSLERLQKLRAYSREKRTWYVSLVSFVTPLPCLILITLVDCVELEPTQAGIYENYVFWVRNFLTVAFISFSTMEQFRNCLPHFPLSSSWMLAITLLATSAGVGEQFAVSHLIGFPLPFGLVIGTTAWLTMIVCCCYYLWGTLLRRDAIARSEFFNYILVFMCQISLTLIYPAYIYVFNSLDSSAQTGFVLLLPVIKLGTKNWISRFLTDMDDMKPEVVIFNIEIFNALYVTVCMQNSTSKLTTIVLMLTDFVQAWMAMKDLNELFVEVDCMIHKMQWLRNQPRPTIVDIAFDIIENDARVRNHPSLRLISVQSEVTQKWATTKTLEIKPTATGSSRQVLPVDDQQQQQLAIALPGQPQTEAETEAAQCVHATEDLPATASKYTAPSLLAHHAVDKKSKSFRTLNDERRVAFIFHALDDDERLLFVTKTVQILFITEFVILIEYTEVVIPIIYCMYMTIMFSLPNRAYYAQLKDLSAERLQEIISNVMMYSCLEMISFLAISLILKYRLRLSTLHQLSFVLDTQWTMVQSKLVLWTFYVVQSSLDHFGVDFSLQFAWLKTAG